MQGNEHPYLIDLLTQPAPTYIHLSDINSIESFFVFTDAAIRCHPFILVASFALTLLLFFVVTNSKSIYNYVRSNYVCNKNSYNKGGE